MQGTNVLFGQIAVVFGIVIAGVWGATQWTAAALGYQVRLGSPWFDLLGTPIYHPWKLFEWWFFFGAYAPEVFDTGGAIAGASGMVAVGVAIAMSVWRSRQARLVTTYGSARWANAQDIRMAGLTHPAGVFLGHTLVAGPTGMGKSVLLATLAMQFRRYRGSRIFAFDMGRSMRATVLGLGGEHYDLGTDGEIAFQPLAHIDREGYRTWAAEWIEGRLLHEGVAVGPDEKAAIWSALGSLAGAPLEQRTMTGLSVLLQSNTLRQALSPYVLGGAHGKLLDADHDRLGMADVQCFEMEELMHNKAAVMAVLHYLFARFDERFDGAPTLLILDEAWLFLDDPVFAARIRQWLKTLRKKNVSVIFATQSLADIKDSSIAPAIIESCASRIFLPNPQATEPQIRTIYEGFGLNSRQIEIVATAQPKRDYYYQSRFGNRLFDLDLGPATLAFAGASTPQDQRDMDRVLLDAGTPGFAGGWLRHCGLDWAADLLPSFPGLAPGSLRTADHLLENQL
uniref:TraG/VirB4 family ATPase n=1 Tax=Burkholderia cenocepacia TaxID=95486 RepID=UPI0038B83762